MKYFFKVGDKPAVAYNVDIDGLCFDDGIHAIAYRMQARKMARIVSFFTARTVKYWSVEDTETILSVTMIKEKITNK